MIEHFHTDSDSDHLAVLLHGPWVGQFVDIQIIKLCVVFVSLLSLHCSGELITEGAQDGFISRVRPKGDASHDGTASADAGTSPCGDRETYFKGNCYLATGLNSMTYQLAQDICTNMKSKPASIHSDEENTFLYGLLFHMTSSAWIGLRRQSYSSSGFVWEDGKKPGYTNWAPGEPDSSECVVIRGPLADQAERGQWADRSCSSKYREVICKRAAGP
jgi:hypothetical protein